MIMMIAIKMAAKAKIAKVVLNVVESLKSPEYRLCEFFEANNNIIIISFFSVDRPVCGDNGNKTSELVIFVSVLLIV